MAYVYYNDLLLGEEEVRIPPDAGAVLFGAGVYASLVCWQGRPFALEEHHARLEAAARRMGLKVPGLAKLRLMVEVVLMKNDLSQRDARCRVWLGQGSPGKRQLLLVTVGAIPSHENEAAAGICPWRRNAAGALTGIKATSYAENTIARQWAVEKGVNEAIFLNTAEVVCEGATSNLFWANSATRQLFTPAEATGCLPGVTRDHVLKLAKKLGFTVEEGFFPVSALTAATEAFFTSTYRVIQPIKAIDNRLFSRHRPMTHQLQAAWKEMEQECRRQTARSAALV